MLFFINSAHLYAEKLEYTGHCGSKGYINDFEHCLDQELIQYNKELNKLYQGLFKNKRLKKAEIIWIKFKEADCDYMAYEVNGGSEYPFIYKACLINKTKARIADLKRSYFYYGWFPDIRN